jgi:hypothetical protein
VLYSFWEGGEMGFGVGAPVPLGEFGPADVVVASSAVSRRQYQQKALAIFSLSVFHVPLKLRRAAFMRQPADRV